MANSLKTGWSQGVDATLARSLLAGVSNPEVVRGHAGTYPPDRGQGAAETAASIAFPEVAGIFRRLFLGIPLKADPHRDFQSSVRTHRKSCRPFRLCRFRPFPASHRNALQYRLRSSALSGFVSSIRKRKPIKLRWAQWLEVCCPGSARAMRQITPRHRSRREEERQAAGWHVRLANRVRSSSRPAAR